MNREELEQIVRDVIDKMGDNVDVEKVALVVEDVVNRQETTQAVVQPQPASAQTEEKTTANTRAIITVFGENKPGVVAAITKILAKHNININDISQRILQEFFSLICIVDLAGGDVSLDQLKNELDVEGTRIGVRVYIQHEDLFRFMHRV